ncbi:MAG: hypothetical protein V8Q42_01595 [Anaerovoracaceae bacterium]
MTDIRKKLAASFICFAMLLSVFSAPVYVLATSAQADGTGSIIFINGDASSDEAEGKTNAEPVKTVSRVKAMLDVEKGTVMVTGTVKFEVIQNWDFGGATIKRNAGFDEGSCGCQSNRVPGIGVKRQVLQKGTVTKNVKGSSKTFTKLKKGKKYYVKVRSYKTSEGKKIYGNYSRVKTVKVK